MRSERLYRILDPEASGSARAFRAVHHAMVAAGIGVMIADTEEAFRLEWSSELDAGFWIVCAFFVAEYVLRLAAAPAAPGAELRGEWRSRLAWAGSMGGLCDLLGTLPGVLAVVFGPDVGSLPGFVWAFKLIRYAPGLAGLQRVISGARSALLSVLLAFCIVLLVSACLAYLIERGMQPQVFSSIPAALWWAIVTLTTTGYGDVTLHPERRSRPDR
jgi:voltage-gated potassium channel